MYHSPGHHPANATRRMAPCALARAGPCPFCGPVAPGALYGLPTALPLLTPHSITSSARRSSEGGIWMPKDRAVAELMTNSNAVGC